MEKPTETQDQALSESVVLIMPHTHAGKDYLIGDTVNVSAAQKQWLISHGRIAKDSEA